MGLISVFGLINFIISLASSQEPQPTTYGVFYSMVLGFGAILWFITLCIDKNDDEVIRLYTKYSIVLILLWLAYIAGIIVFLNVLSPNGFAGLDLFRGIFATVTLLVLCLLACISCCYGTDVNELKDMVMESFVEYGSLKWSP